MQKTVAWPFVGQGRSPRGVLAWRCFPRLERVIRGGGCNNDPWDLRSANRNDNWPDNRNDNLGLRLLRFADAPQPRGTLE